MGWNSRARASASAAARGHQDFEAFVARQIAEDARVVRIVFDDQQDGFARLQIFAIVGDLLGRTFRTIAVARGSVADGELERVLDRQR